MADPSTQTSATQAEMATATALPFRFEVTWRSLTRGLEPVGGSAAAAGALVPARKTQTLQTAAQDAKEWEMVLPRMSRRVEIQAPPAAVTEVAAPRFAAAASAEPESHPRWMLLAGVPALLAVAGAGVYWGSSRPEPKPEKATVATMEMGSAGWMTEPASDRVGSARGRQISLYRPTMKLSDYRLDFTGRIEKNALAWVFRAVDTRNYYVGKLEAASISAPLVISHFAVIDGVEGPHVQRALAHPGATPWKLRLDVRGPRFTVYLQNQVVEDWQDNRLKSGGVGFLNERVERGEVGSIQISFPGGASR